VRAALEKQPFCDGSHKERNSRRWSESGNGGADVVCVCSAGHSPVRWQPQKLATAPGPDLSGPGNRHGAPRRNARPSELFSRKSRRAAARAARPAQAVTDRLVQAGLIYECKSLCDTAAVGACGQDPASGPVKEKKGPAQPDAHCGLSARCRSLFHRRGPGPAG
jgi:hypothetical protein